MSKNGSISHTVTVQHTTACPPTPVRVRDGYAVSIDTLHTCTDGRAWLRYANVWGPVMLPSDPERVTESTYVTIESPNYRK